MKKCFKELNRRFYSFLHVLSVMEIPNNMRSLRYRAQCDGVQSVIYTVMEKSFQTPLVFKLRINMKNHRPDKNPNIPHIKIRTVQ